MQLHAEDVNVQHRRLGQLVNELAAALAAEHRRCFVIRRALGALINFSEIHFSDQEEFMKLHEYPRELLEVHMAAHLEFLAKLRAVHDNSDGDLMALGPALIAWIRDWIDDHVRMQDRAYLRELLMKGTPLADNV
jgi:hemerythrin-like metal-binding protein